jgi:enediyne biosynthesis protein E4
MPVNFYRTVPLLILFIWLFSGCKTDQELEWIEEDGYRWADVNTRFFGDTGFELRTSSQTGIDFRNDVSDEIIRENRHYANGSGVTVGDVTGNGFPDIYFANLEGPNRLYENLGNFQFRDITAEAGVAHEGYNSSGVLFADVNANGLLDLLITSLSDGNRLYLNNGDGTFELNSDSGLGSSSGAHSMAMADINGNGLPDLYIANYRLRSVRDLYGPGDLELENTVRESEDGRIEVLPEFEEYYEIIQVDGNELRQESGAYDELYLNKGDGVFEAANPDIYFPVNDVGQPGLFRDWGFTPVFRDITGNGAPDLYVVNDFWTPDRLWLNRGDGTFEAAGQNAIRSQSFSSMGVDFTDLNKNGYPDFVITEMLSADHSMRIRQYSDHMEEYHGSTHHHRNSVYLNRKDTTFAEIAWYSGLEASEWSWATTFMDINLNGHEDLIVANGFYRDYLDMDAQIEIHQLYQEMGEEIMERQGEFLQFPVLELQNKFFRNNGDLTFTDVSSEWGFNIEDISMGMAVGDLNNDGSLDLVINRFNDEAVIYENTTNNPRIGVRLNGRSPNTMGVGAKVELIGGPEMQTSEMMSGGNYLSGSQYQLMFAANDESSAHTIVVTWRNGEQSRIDNVMANRIYEIDEPETDTQSGMSRSESETTAEPKTTLFEDVSYLLSHTHHESNYNDFQRVQPLLPKSLSRQGPAVGWFDLNGNGFDDLIITSGKGGSPALFENSGGNEFDAVALDAVTDTAPGDQVSVAGWESNNGFHILTGSSNYEQGSPAVPSALIFGLSNDGSVSKDSIPGILSSTGPVAAADYNKNGSVDLFIGGHFLPGGYPRDASSRLFFNRNGDYVIDEINSDVLSELGLATSALFADFTQNGWPDLLISTEWGPLKLFENREGRFHEITEEAGLAGWKGWWNGVASGDFTNNGLTDFVATNKGLNSPYRTDSENPIRLYYEDLNMNGQLDIVDVYYHNDLRAYVPRRKLLDFGSVRTILQNVSSHAEFSTSAVDQIFDMNFSEVPYKEINTLEHTVFINTGDGFDAYPLPAKAQFSTAYDITVADFNNNGYEDLFISQNSFEYPPLVNRQASGRGLILLGDGDAGFEVLPGKESGIKIYGEQRGAAVSDFNRNGKTDLVVSQNGGETRLFKNSTEKTGIRIRLTGPDNNVSAIGSGLRIVYEDGSKGPLRTIQAGSGYRSQNSTTQVLGAAKTPSHIEITWPDGMTDEVSISEGRLEYEIDYPD